MQEKLFRVIFLPIRKNYLRREQQKRRFIIEMQLKSLTN